MFAPSGKYEPCGLFTTSHFVALAICLLLVLVLVTYSLKLSNNTFNKIIKVSAIIITILEIIKKIFNLYHNPNAPINDWLPFHYCSLFIYSLWLSGYFKGMLKKIGDSFLVGGGIIAGLIFLIIPSSSLRLFPIFHFQCLYSLLFHSLFLYCGLVILIKNYFTLSVKTYFYYFIFCTFFCTIAVILNSITDSNFMFLDNPWGIPLPFLSKIEKECKVLYIIIIYIAYTCGTYFTTMLIQKMILKLTKEKTYE